jgi:hypothetical protein
MNSFRIKIVDFRGREPRAQVKIGMNGFGESDSCSHILSNVQKPTQTPLHARQPSGAIPAESGASLPWQGFLVNLTSTGVVASISSTQAPSAPAKVFDDDATDGACKRFGVLDLEILYHYSFSGASNMFVHEGHKIPM